jgi:hypothetical protein
MPVASATSRIARRGLPSPNARMTARPRASESMKSGSLGGAGGSAGGRTDGRRAAIASGGDYRTERAVIA